MTNKPYKINKEARKCLNRAYNNLARSIDAVVDLEQVFREQKDKRIGTAKVSLALILKALRILNVLAEHEDIGIV